MIINVTKNQLVHLMNMIHIPYEMEKELFYKKYGNWEGDGLARGEWEFYPSRMTDDECIEVYEAITNIKGE